MNEWGNDDSDILRVLYSVYKKLGPFFFQNYSLTCLNNDTLALFFFNWDSLHARLNSHRNTKRLKHTGNLFRKNIQLPVNSRLKAI